jgi:hypothetical protein
MELERVRTSGKFRVGRTKAATTEHIANIAELARPRQSVAVGFFFRELKVVDEKHLCNLIL